MGERHQAEINHEAYIRKYQADLENEHTGESALMRNGEIVAIVNDSAPPTTAGVYSSVPATSRSSESGGRLCNWVPLRF